MFSCAKSGVTPCFKGFFFICPSNSNYRVWTFSDFHVHSCDLSLRKREMAAVRHRMHKASACGENKCESIRYASCSVTCSTITSVRSWKARDASRSLKCSGSAFSAVGRSKNSLPPPRQRRFPRLKAPCRNMVTTMLQPCQNMVKKKRRSSPFARTCA